MGANRNSSTGRKGPKSKKGRQRRISTSLPQMAGPGRRLARAQEEDKSRSVEARSRVTVRPREFRDKPQIVAD